MKYLLSIIILIIWVCFSFFSAGIPPSVEEIKTTYKAQSFVESELSKYIKKCDDGYYYIGQRNEFKNKEKTVLIWYQRIEDYSVRIVNRSNNPKERIGYLTVINSDWQQASDGKHEGWFQLFKTDISTIFTVKINDEITFENPFEGIHHEDDKRIMSYELSENFSCGDWLNQTQK